MKIHRLPAAILLASAFALTACGPESANDGGAKIKFYQSPMHPWIKSDQPGNCTICGMKLVPVLEGDAGFESEPGTVTLDASTIQLLRVETATATQQPLTRTLRLAGTIDDDSTRHRVLAAYVDGRIDRLAVNYLGAEVREGQLLAELYSPELLNAEKEYRLALRQGSDSPLARNSANKLRQLGLTDAQINVLPQRDPDAIRTDIVAPLTGTVVAQSVYEGQYVSAGDPLFEIADFDTMWFMGDVYERDLPLLRVGQEATVTTAAAPGRTFPGTVTFIDPNFDPMTRSTKVRIEIPNLPDPETGRRPLPHRVFAQAEIPVTAADTLTVPRTAVLDTGQRAVVYLPVDGGAYRQRLVRVGNRGTESVEILEGLAPGDTVVTNGNLLIDAEAQIASSGQTSAPTPTPHPSGEAATPALNSQLSTNDSATFSPFLAAVSALGTALAADDLASFQKVAAAQLPPAMGSLNALTSEPAKAFAARIHAAAHFAEPTDLPGARAAFEPLAAVAADIALAPRAAGSTEAPLVFQCPMTSSAFPDAPPEARWIQTTGPIQNPYFGPAMLDCGTEVKP